jgi:hypothetical protein
MGWLTGSRWCAVCQPLMATAMSAALAGTLLY